jgi:hypothetical protein
MMHWVNEAFAIGTVIVLLIIWRGLVGWAMQRERDATMHLAMGVSGIIWAVVFRVLYWDVVPTLVDAAAPGTWASWGEATGWTRVNVIFDLLLLFAGYHLLKALQLLIPAEERHDWPLWKAPFYPHGHIFDRLKRWWRK